jgi:DNA topoisomerase-1
MCFAFRGKSGKEHVVAITDRRLARTVQRCQEIPGEELFQYIDDDGQRHAVDSGDVNDYLREVSGEELTAKDFRTWGGTVLMARALAEVHKEGGPPTKKRVVEAVKRVAEKLGNTAAVCRKSYIHPDVIALYQAGALVDALTRAAGRRGTIPGLSAEETAVLTLLEERKLNGPTKDLTTALEASVSAVGA